MSIAQVDQDQAKGRKRMLYSVIGQYLLGGYIITGYRFMFEIVILWLFYYNYDDALIIFNV